MNNEETKKLCEEDKGGGMSQKKSFLKYVCVSIRRFVSFVWKQPLLQSLLISYCLFSLIDILHYRTFWGAIIHFFTYPHFFVLNVLIVWGTLLPALFLRRRYAYYITISTLWLGFGIANFIMLTPGIRTTPVDANDLEILLKDPLSIVGMVLQTEYLSLFALILIGVAILLAIAGIVLLWFKLPLRKRAPIQALISVVSTALVLTVVIIPLRATGVLPSRFKNLEEAYSIYGFSYCLPCTFIDRGIDRPDKYRDNGEEEIEKIKASYAQLKTAADAEKPNIIFLQLESFFNVNDLSTYVFNQDPTPFFNGLKDIFPHGYLTVPSIAAGTVNTEFEVITGMSLDFFGATEYPYKTILKETTCESVPYLLKNIGYETTAIHNHTATFYDRHKVYDNLGFDHFISKEFMQSSDNCNLTGWVRDAVLTEEIMKALSVSEKTDYIYAVSVQGHGGYPSNGKIDDYGVNAVPLGEREETEIMQYNYYVNQLRDMDNFLHDLTDALSAFDEKTVLVMYGDHLPGLNIKQDDFKENTADLFKTEYVIWSNYNLHDGAAGHKDLTSYQLAAYVMELLGLHEGNVIRYHQTNSSSYQLLDESENYSEGLWILQYDILYGKRYVYNGESPYKATDMTLGVDSPVIKSTEEYVRGFMLYGENFTPDTKVMLNGEEVETVVYFGPDQLVVAPEDGEHLKKGDKITVYYQGMNMEILLKEHYIVP